MKLDDKRESRNVVVHRGMGNTGKVMVGGGLGTIILVILSLFLGQDPMEVIGNQQPNYTATESEMSPAYKNAVSFTSKVLAQTEDVWTELFKKEGYQYQQPILNIFNGQIHSGCGMASAATGPFYCPANSELYIDLSFYNELQNRFSAPGDFAMAYVIAHEVGHHIQNLTGISDKVQSMRGRVSEKEYNQLSVRLELQADFLAGVWAHYAEKMNDVISPGDIEEALNAAHAIGDDRIQKQTQGYVVPDAFTHGTSAQRAYWFKKGYTTGDMNQGDTFNSEI